MRTLLIVSAALMVLAACSPVTPLPAQPTVELPTLAAPTATSAAAPGGAAATQPPAPTQAAPPANAAPIALQVTSPQDGAVVNTQQIAITGAASPGAVVTVNDDIIVVGADGQFNDTVTLSEGPNLIEVIASNTSGSETSVELTVTYEP